MKLVIIESPLAGDVKRNKSYARACLKDSILRGEAPFASHLFYPQVLDDLVLEERTLGISAGLAWAEKAKVTAVYIDLGISNGMKQGIKHAKKLKRKIEYRKLYA